ncbi:hypothetical protein TELCIR_24398, partial [Teladorsagia circumcincta]
IELLYHGRPGLTTYKLSRQIGFTFETRDHMLLQAYLSLPPEIALRDPKDVSAEDREYAELGMLPMKPQKMVVAVHGGPQNRDRYTFSPRRIWLANRGYAVLQVNFRGSTGFGKRYKNAGNGEWSRKMHYDILDGVEFTIAKGIADRTQVAILGDSYGGYEVLVALTFSPNVFACGVASCAPSNLVTTMESAPPHWHGVRRELARMMGGDIDT